MSEKLGEPSALTGETVLVKVPPTPAHLALLRTAVGGIAARDDFTLEQVDDLRMAVEEAAVQLLKHNRGDPLTLEVTTTDIGLDVTLESQVSTGKPVIDRSSFSWTILEALADHIAVDSTGDRGRVVLSKHRTDLGGG